MKILIVSWYFPPVNTIGALRVGKFARFLIERGHDIGVVAGSNWGHPETLPLGVRLDRVVYAPWIDINTWPGLLRQRLLRPFRLRQTATEPSASSAPVPRSTEAEKSLRQRLYMRYVTFTNIPDNRVGWFPGAARACSTLCENWRPDLVFASGPPFTALLAARRISRRLGVPWVAELRDRWADDPYGAWPRWRLGIDQWLERRTLATARALVTVTEPWAEFYRRKYNKPAATIYNGYDPLDFLALPETVPLPSGPHLQIGYTGGIYPGRRDPTPLFEALRLMGPLGERFRVVFVATDPAHVWPLAQCAQVRHLVEVRPALPYAQSLEFQQRSDVLLLMQWNDPREQGNCPGKFFEYMASLRPILILGLQDGVPATIVRERGAGHCINDPAGIAAQLQVWLREKEEKGLIAALPSSVREGLSRTIQYERLEAFLTTVRCGG